MQDFTASKSNVLYGEIAFLATIFLNAVPTAKPSPKQLNKPVARTAFCSGAPSCLYADCLEILLKSHGQQTVRKFAKKIGSLLDDNRHLALFYEHTQRRKCLLVHILRKNSNEKCVMVGSQHL